MIRTALSAAADRIASVSESARLDAELLLGHVLGWNRAQLCSRDDQPLSDRLAALYESLVSRRCTGEPVAYLLGYREFWKSRFAVAPGVLVPRPETELLVETGIAWLSGIPTPRVLDLGCGSGAIGLSIALERPDAQVTLVDRSPCALRIAEENRAAFAVHARLLHSAWYDELAGERFDLILANPPYIAPDDPHLQTLELSHEPREALMAMEAGFSDLRIIAERAPQHLSAGGFILMEHGHTQAPGVRELLKANGFEKIRTFRDLAGLERATGGGRGD
jgi:release factor glutamine methyltransferase